jgi:uncharacterized damage-inducible protein DinB
MDTSALLTDAFSRIRETVHRAVDGLDPDELAFRPDHDSNSIAWLVWHLTRIQDDHVAEVAGLDQIWTAPGRAERFAFPFPDSATGYGHGSDDVAAVRVNSADLLVGYHDAVFEQTTGYLATISADDLDRVVDAEWDPPVTLGVRLMSVINDDLQHAGQAAFVRGLLERRRSHQR